MSAAKKCIVAILAIAVILIGGIAIAISTMDINQYRDKIADALGAQTGRTVKLAGPIKLAVSAHGIGLAVQDVSISNAPWASKPLLAGIGKLELGVALMPLLDHKVVITELNVNNADIQLETNASGQHNWDLKPAGASAPASSQTAEQPASGSGNVGISVKELSVKDSQVSMRGKDGKTSQFKVTKLSLAPGSRGVEVTFDGDYNDAPIKLDVKTGASDLMADTKWPFDAELSYTKYSLNAKGDANTTAKVFNITDYELKAGSSTLHGQLAANLGGSRPSIKGSLNSDKLDMADFKTAEDGHADKAAEESATKDEPSKRLFSTTPLDLSALKSADVALDIAIGEVSFGKATLQKITGSVELNNGQLALAPLKAMLGESALQGDIKLEASAPARYSLSFKAPGVDIANLLEMGGAQAFLSGKGDADIDLSGSGSSLHEMAASTQGHIIVTAAGGKIDAAEAGQIAAGLMQIFAPGNANPALNCLAARFNVAAGVAKDNGILADSSASTVAGSGGFNLGEETIALTLNAKPKVVDTRGINPALQISGPLTSPHFGIDAAGAVQNVAGALLKDKLKGNSTLGGLLGGAASASATDGGIPAIAAAPNGENACVYTLDHKTAATAAQPQNSAVKDVSGQPAVPTNAKDAGKQLMQGIFGK